mgnify:CR=1 FL=1
MSTSGTYTFNPSLGELTLYAYNLIDGVEYTPVTKFNPTDDRIHQVHYLRKDTLEVVK